MSDVVRKQDGGSLCHSLARVDSWASVCVWTNCAERNSWRYKRWIERRREGTEQAEQNQRAWTDYLSKPDSVGDVGKSLVPLKKTKSCEVGVSCGEEWAFGGGKVVSDRLQDG